MGIIDMAIIRPLRAVKNFRPHQLKALLKLRWWDERYTDLRYGHSFYFVYPIGIFNFILISYRMFVKPLADMFVSVFPPLWRFQTLSFYMLVFPVTYIPMAIYVGYLHKEKMENQRIERQQKQAEDRLEASRRKAAREKAARERELAKKPVTEEKAEARGEHPPDFVCPYFEKLKATLIKNGVVEEDEIEKAERFLLEETTTEEVL